MDKTLKKYFLQQYRKGRSVLADVLDKCVSVIGVFLIASMVLWGMGVKVRGALLFALAIVIIYAAVSYKLYKRKVEKFIKNVREETKKNIAYEKIASDDIALKRIADELIRQDGKGEVKGDVIITPQGIYSIKLYHPLYEFTANDALLAIKECNKGAMKRVKVITTAKISNEARSVLYSNNGDFDDKILYELMQEYSPKIEEVDDYLKGKYEEQRISIEKLKRDFIKPSKALRWAACSVMLIVFGLILKKGILYFSASGICGALCGYCLLKEKREH